MRFPAYGRALWDRRLSGQRPRVVALLVGDYWMRPKWLPPEIPRLAVKTSQWRYAGIPQTDDAPETLKGQARDAVKTAIANGALRRRPCEICGKRSGIEAHHPSYAKTDWLNVRWLCTPHHIGEHVALRNLRKAARQQYDWRLVAAMTVLAIDAREASERVEIDGCDEWFWLLADVQKHARDVLIFTPTIECIDPPDGFAPERTLEVYAWLHRKLDSATGQWLWPRWWPFGESAFERDATA